jgi:hypothetical protein
MIQVTNALLLLAVSLICIKPLSVAAQNALSQGVSHNDYLQKRPLQDALDAGYINIEADIFLHHGKLVVAHWFPYLKGARTLDELYLEPLSLHVKQHRNDAGFLPITLLIDIKSSPEKTYLALNELLQNYRDVLTCYQNGQVRQGPVNIVLTGRKPVQLIQRETERWVTMDDFLNAPATETNPFCFTMASCRYSRIIKSKNKLTADEKTRLRSWVNIAHRNGKKARLWASPERDEIRTDLLECGIDLINTDRLNDLKRFLQQPVIATGMLAQKTGIN